MDDLWREQDGGGASIFILPVLSDAFDTINHDVLLGQPEELGLDSTVLYWFTSFLQGWSQSVLIGSEKLQLMALPLWSVTGFGALSAPYQHLHVTAGWGHLSPWGEVSPIYWWYPVIYLRPGWIECCSGHRFTMAGSWRIWMGKRQTSA